MNTRRDVEEVPDLATITPNPPSLEQQAPRFPHLTWLREIFARSPRALPAEQGT